MIKRIEKSATVNPETHPSREFKNSGAQIYWIGKENSLEHEFSKREGFSFEPIKSSGFRKKSFIEKILSVFYLITSFINSIIILLKIKPYREEQTRHLIFNCKTQQVLRQDAIAHACIQLPEDHGIIFPGGYYLQNGENKSFDGRIVVLRGVSQKDKKI